MVVAAECRSEVLRGPRLGGARAELALGESSLGGGISADPFAEHGAVRPAQGGAKSWWGLSWDHVGAIASALCVVHCIALPMLLPALAVCGISWVGWECCGESVGLVHLLLYCLVVPVAIVALVAGYRRHQTPHAFLVGAIGVVLLSLALVAAQMPTAMFAERLLTLGGSVALIVAHALNQRRCCR